MAAIENIYQCPDCDWTHDGRHRPVQEENNRVDSHAIGHGKRCRPFLPTMGKLIHVATPYALDQWGEWWEWVGGKWRWAPYGAETNAG